MTGPDGGKPLIVAAAIRYGVLIISTPRPGRHHTVLHAMHAMGVEDPGPDAQGFLTDDGQFLSRWQAERAARASGQITKMIGSILTSEDLW